MVEDLSKGNRILGSQAMDESDCAQRRHSLIVEWTAVFTGRRLLPVHADATLIFHKDLGRKMN